MLVKRSVTLAGHRTSIALEAEFWDALDDVARQRGCGVAALIAAEDAGRLPTQPLASLLRIFVLRVLRT